MSQLGPYSTSSALSTTHYKLVQSLESSRSPTEQHSHLSSCLSKIRYSWSRTQPKPAQAYHDLVLILYCHSQRSQAFKDDEERELWEGEWIKLECVRLAGGIGTLKQRELGYRACIELFPFFDEFHSLKLLLINSIRSDLYVERGSSKAEQRWTMALKAIASDNLVTIELIPAVEERVLELLRSEEESTAIRKLALQALLSLVKASSSAQETDDFSTLSTRAKQTILDLLTPALPSSSIKSPPSKHRTLHSSLLQSSSLHASSSVLFDPTRATRRPIKKNLPFALHLSLISHLSPTSPLHPISSDIATRLNLFLPILHQFTIKEEKRDSESRRTRWMGLMVKHVWGLGRTLGVLEEVLRDLGDERINQNEVKVKDEIAKELERILKELLQEEDSDKGRGMKNALILSILLVLSIFAPSLDRSIVTIVLAYLNQCLLLSVSNPRHPDTILQLFVLQSLALVPPSSWTGEKSETEEKGKGRERETETETKAEGGWNEESWRAILSGFGSQDENVRRATIHLISLVDTKLLELHYSQLFASLSDSLNHPDSLAKLFPLLLELLPYLSSSPSRPSPSFWTSRRLPLPSQLTKLLENPSLSLEATSVIPSLVLTILNDFRYHSHLFEQRQFASNLWQIGTEERGFEREVKGWKANVMLGGLMAGTIHRSVREEDENGEGDMDGVRKVLELTDWLGDDRVAEEVKEILTEPFLFALLRILSLSINHEPPPTFDFIHQLNQITNSLTNLSESPTFLDEASANRELLEIALEATKSTENLYKLHDVGMRTKDRSLAEFGESLFETFQLDSSASLPPISAAQQRMNDGIERSVAAMRRERNDLRRERSDRGGVVSSNEKVESLMTPKEDNVDLPRGAEASNEQRDEEEDEEEKRRVRETTFSTYDGNEVSRREVSI
ncbi:hypothetical protein JCM5353_007093 [Sporobolomyces roseus]